MHNMFDPIVRSYLIGPVLIAMSIALGGGLLVLLSSWKKGKLRAVLEGSTMVLILAALGMISGDSSLQAQIHWMIGQEVHDLRTFKDGIEEFREMTEKTP